MGNKIVECEISRLINIPSGTFSPHTMQCLILNEAMLLILTKLILLLLDKFIKYNNYF